jgi:hypothetical protein
MMAASGLPTPPRTPVIGYALSGGGYRAMRELFLCWVGRGWADGEQSSVWGALWLR